MTGPPCSVTDPDRRRQTPPTVTNLSPYTMYRRASNKLSDNGVGRLNQVALRRARLVLR